MSRSIGMTAPWPVYEHSREHVCRVYASQVLEKQRTKATYGVNEGQFRRYFARAQGRAGVVGRNLLRLLEQRLDNVVYRLRFARSRPMARQMVSHGQARASERPTSRASMAPVAVTSTTSCARPATSG